MVEKELRQQQVDSSKKRAAQQLLAPLETQQGNDCNNDKLTEKYENLPTFLFGILFKYSYISLTSLAFVLFGIDWILDIVLASVTDIDSSTTFLLPVAYDTKHPLPLLHS